MIHRVRVPSAIKLLFPIIMSLWLLVTTMYHLGADGISAEESDLSFEREYDRRLFKASKGFAFQVSSHEVSEPTVVQYEPCVFPISWLCGRYETARMILPGPLFRKDNLIVSARLGHEGYFALNTETNTAYRMPSDEIKDPLKLHAIPDFQLVSLYAQVGFDPISDATEPITYDSITQGATWSEISVSQEGCIIFNMAFVALLLLMVLVVLIASIKAHLENRRTQPILGTGGD